MTSVLGRRCRCLHKLRQTLARPTRPHGRRPLAAAGAPRIERHARRRRRRPSRGRGSGSTSPRILTRPSTAALTGGQLHHPAAPRRRRVRLGGGRLSLGPLLAPKIEPPKPRPGSARGGLLLLGRACHVRERAPVLCCALHRAPAAFDQQQQQQQHPRRPTRQQQQEEEEEGRPSRRRRPPPTSPRLSAPPRARRRSVVGARPGCWLFTLARRHRCVQSYFARIYSSRSPRCCTRCGACAAAPSASLAASAASTSGASPRFSTLCDARRSTWSRPPKPGEAREMRRDCG